MGCRRTVNSLLLTRPFSLLFMMSLSCFELYSDLAKISEWAFKCKMSFNSDPTKSAQEVISVES